MRIGRRAHAFGARGGHQPGDRDLTGGRDQPLPPDLAEALALAESRLAGFGRLRFLTETGSTNDAALALAASGAPEGTAVVADQQQHGRGRRGRTWFSPPGAGLYLSVVVRPGELADLPVVTLAAGVAAARAVHAVSGLPIELKWPNDLVMGRPWRKLGGLLCEAMGTGPRVEAVVVGIGINLRPAAYPPDIADRATSLEAELGRPIDRGALTVECLDFLREAIDALRDGRRADVLNDWRRFGRSGLSGAAVRWQDQGAERRGAARDLDEDGALLVDSDGRIERIVAGEVTWERR